MELFSEARRFHKVHWLFRRLKHPTDLNMAVLLNSLVRSKIPKKGFLASVFLKEIVRKKHFPVDTRLATLVVLAWAKSDAPSAAKKALAIHEQLQETLSHDPPSIVYYNAILECISVSGGKEAVKRTEDLMELIHRVDLTPNEITYTLAIRALLRGGDDIRADEMLDRMRESPYPPRIRTFNTIMAFHAHAGVLGSAIQVEQMVLELHRQSRTQPHLAPDAVSYNIIYSAWAKADIAFSSNRMMKVYDRMQRVGLEPNLVTFTTLIHYLSSTGDWGDMSRAQDLLTTLEEHPTLQPDRRHYYQIMHGWNDMDVPEFGEEILKRRITAYVNGNTKVAPIR